ncbi:Glycosyltransferase involved in cell wall bisynthesis [Desulfotomaculum arcticum]|uniref:Glycosyltransferase involved in cell wall bisynthesis n=1 Tax=Desulfotruncus arcticus DSM 17038 TaxID=1121424 RepID=A0A1I2WZT1_9FIRM|nr:glycosyltransferase [Desulfotruncus arcticus]SFH06808.1 Glycosyltransferase involved in cell wall bisynthesis [Desulfotomaculum arcticum] [Desulfotruncus arcticus DSM 17038]
MPKVSIIIPVYNVETYLRECLDSVLNQTLKDIEIICINDGSTDGSPSILDEYAAKDSRVKVINKPNSGYGHTMNVGMDEATGEYIGIVESDDYVKQNMYEILYNIAAEQDLDLIKADFYRFTNEEGTLNLQYTRLAEQFLGYYNKVLCPYDDLNLFRFIMNTWSGIYKRDFLNVHDIRHNETRGASFQDNGFFFQTFCWAKRVYFLDRPFYMNRRDNPNSSVHNKEKVFCVSEEYQFIRDFLEQNADFKNHFMPVYQLKKYHNYMFTVDRVGDEFKLMFLYHFSKEFQQSALAGELDRKIFTGNEWETLNRIMEDPEKYYCSLRKDSNGIVSCLRKILSGISYCREYGLKAAFIRLKEKL